jgi:hypothetical protein
MTQQVLVWQSYGNVDVYAADTADQVQSLCELILTVGADYWPDASQRDRYRAHMNKHSDNRVELMRVFRALQQCIQPSFSNDAFEILEIVQMREPQPVDTDSS